ncbi:cytochrome P450 [Cystobacter fuscus]|nr:cytochrome P450 [Cystobacter fuscus]
MKAYAGIPGPAPSLPLGNAQDFIGKLPWEVCSQFAERYGGMLLVWFLGTPTLIVTDPELIWRVLEGDFDSYYKASPRKQFLPIITDASEFIANGARWKQKRETDPARNATGPRGFEFDAHAVREALSQKVRAQVEATRGEPLGDVVPVIARLAFEALSIQAVGRLLEDELFDTFQTLVKVGTDRINSPIPLPFTPAGARARGHWQARFERLVREARQSPGTGRSVLHATLQVGTALDDATLATQLGNIFFGGMTSITSGVIHTLYLLTRHPDVRERVLAEVRGLATRELDPMLEVLESCPEFNRVVLESLRVLPPVPIYSRCSSPDRQVTLGGHVLPPNTDLLLTCWPLHRSARHWKDPERFEPDRWKGNTLAENPLGSGYFFPFGRGRRACAGSALGLLNIKLLLVSLLTASRPEVGAHQEYKGELFFGTMRPKGMSVRFLPVG